MPQDHKLPKLRRAKLDASEVRAYLDELGRTATILRIRIKGGASERSEEAALDLAMAQALVASGEVAGVQIAYRRGDSAWIDTLMTAGMPPGGARLVGMPLETPDGPPG